VANDSLRRNEMTFCRSRYGQGRKRAKDRHSRFTSYSTGTDLCEYWCWGDSGRVV